MEENLEEIEQIKSYTASQFIKGEEAEAELLKISEECQRLNITQHPLLSK